MTVVVPSPTSSSCVLLSSIMLLAAGCATSISRSIACPSLVMTMPPMGSRSILSIALGPRHDRTMSATLGLSVQGRSGLEENVRLGRCDVRDLRFPADLSVAILRILEDLVSRELYSSSRIEAVAGPQNILITTTGACILFRRRKRCCLQESNGFLPLKTWCNRGRYALSVYNSRSESCVMDK